MNNDKPMSATNGEQKESIFELYNGSSLQNNNKRLNLHVAYIMAYYGFSNGIIGALTNHEHRAVKKIIKICMGNHNRTTSTRKCNRYAEISTILNSKTASYYSVLLTLYVTFHGESPYKSVDLSALLRAWICFKSLMKSGLENRIVLNPALTQSLNINNFYLLCLSMTCISFNVTTIDFAMLSYSKELNCFFAKSAMSKGTIRTPVKIRSMNEIEAEIKNKKLQKEAGKNNQNLIQNYNNLLNATK